MILITNNNKLGGVLSAGAVLGETDTERDARIFKTVLVERTLLRAEYAERELVRRSFAMANLAAQRAVSCADLEVYNELALHHWRTHLALYLELSRAGAKIEAPWQPPLWGDVKISLKCLYDPNCVIRTSVPCVNGKVDFAKLKLTMAPQYLDTFKVFTFASGPSPMATLESLEFVPAIVVWVGVLLFAGAVGSWAISNVIDSINGVEIKRLEAEYNKQAPKYGAAAMDKLQECTTQLIEKGVDPLVARRQCGADVVKVFPQVVLPESSPTVVGSLVDIVKWGALIGGGLWFFKYAREEGWI